MRVAAVIRQPAVVGARARAALTPGPRLRRRLAIVLALTALLTALYLVWLRDSSLVEVQQVTVTGLTSRDSDEIRAALTSTAKTMTTLHLDQARLDHAAAAFPVVAAVELSADFPHGLTVRVIEHRPAAILAAGNAHVPVAGDGSVLAGIRVEGKLPTIDLSGSAPDRRLPPGAALDSALVAGAAPAVIARRLESIGREGGARGVVAQVVDGPEIVFGSPERLRAKWAAAVRVLADEQSAGATYIDVRIPERPVAGGLSTATAAPVTPAYEAPVTPAPTPAAPTYPTPSAPADQAPATPAPATPTYPQP